MVKPDILYALAKESKPNEAESIGRLVRYLVGHRDFDLDSKERVYFEAISKTNEWHTEAVGALKERDRLRKEAYRKKKNPTAVQDGTSVCPTDKTGQDGTSVCPTVKTGQDGTSVCPTKKSNPSLTPLLTHSKKESVSKRDAAHSLLKFDADKLSADLGIPKSFVAATLSTWKRTGWHTTQGKAIDEHTLKPMLDAFWKNEKDKARYEKSEKPAKTYTSKDWELCKDWCANYKRGGGCMRGVEVPPDLNETRKHHPNECGKFSPKPEDAKA